MFTITLVFVICLQEEAEKKEAKKAGKKITVTELPIEAFTHGYSQVELNNYIEQEVSISIFIVVIFLYLYWIM